MQLFWFVGAVLIGTICAAISWALILFQVDPIEAGAPAITLFLVTLFIWLTGVIFLISLAIRWRLGKRQVLDTWVALPLRRGLMLAGLVVGWLLLHLNHLANWFTTLIFIVLLAVLEFFFMTHRTPLIEPNEQQH